MSFQLLCYDEFFPININSLMNTSAFFCFNFLPNIILIDDEQKELISDNLWFENNIMNHNSFNGPSFIFTNLSLICTTFMILLSILLLYQVIYASRGIRRIRISFNLFSILIYINQSTFYQFTISSLGSVFYDTNNYNYFSFSSYEVSFIYLIIQILTSLYLILQLYNNRNRLDSPEVEEIVGDIYISCKNNQKSIYATVIYNLKLQIIMFLLFEFQHNPNIEIVFITLIYTFSLLYLLFVQPFESNLELIQNIIKELLILAISIMFGVIKIYLENGKFIETLKDILLILFISVIGNEFLFIFLNFIITCKDYLSSFCDNSKKKRIPSFKIK